MGGHSRTAQIDECSDQSDNHLQMEDGMIDQRKVIIADLLVALLLESWGEVGGHLAERIAGCIADSGML